MNAMRIPTIDMISIWNVRVTFVEAENYRVELGGLNRFRQNEVCWIDPGRVTPFTPVAPLGNIVILI